VIDDVSASKLPSAAFFTIFNTYGTLNCCATTENVETVACGYADSVVRVHKSDGSNFRLATPMTSSVATPIANPSPPRLDFVGHQGPVYGVDFCDQDQHYLVSASADR